MSEEKSDSGFTMTGGTIRRIGKGGIGIRITDSGPVRMDGIDIEDIDGKAVIVESSKSKPKDPRGLVAAITATVIAAGIAKALGWA
jgi:hypothetical protein